MSNKCKHISPQGRLCRNDGDHIYTNLHFCIEHIDEIIANPQAFDRALICLKHRTRLDTAATNRASSNITSFINWLKRNRFEIIQVDPEGGYVAHTLDSVRKQWEKRT